MTLVSPLDYLGRNYLFSAHMVQHILLLLVIPLMLLSGIPEAAAERAFMVLPIAGGVIKFLGQPHTGMAPRRGLDVGLAHAVAPRYRNENENLYIAQQISFVLTGVIFWWPVFAPVKAARLAPLAATLYLASACLGCTVLGMLITFAGAGLYPHT